MNESLFTLLAVAAVALSALFVLTGPSTGMLTVDCVQVISPTGVGHLYCGEELGDSGETIRRITKEDVQEGVYNYEPMVIEGKAENSFPTYLERRLERNV